MMTFTLFRLSDGQRTETELAKVPEDLDLDLFGWRPEPEINADQYVWDADVPGYVDAHPVARLSPPMTVLAFTGRLSLDERLALWASTSPVVVDFRERLRLAAAVDLGDAFIVDGVNLLETQGVIGEGRAAQILAGAMPPA